MMQDSWYIELPPGASLGKTNLGFNGDIVGYCNGKHRIHVTFDPAGLYLDI